MRRSDKRFRMPSTISRTTNIGTRWLSERTQALKRRWESSFTDVIERHAQQITVLEEGL